MQVVHVLPLHHDDCQGIAVQFVFWGGINMLLQSKIWDPVSWYWSSDTFLAEAIIRSHDLQSHITFLCAF